MMTTCPTCRAQLPEGTKFCGGCGSKVEAIDAFPRTQISPAVAAAPQIMQVPGLSAGAPAPLSAMAVAGFVCGLLGLVPYWIGFTLCILGIIFSSIGLSATGESRGMRGRGLAIAGLVLSCVFLLPASCGL